MATFHHRDLETGLVQLVARATRGDVKSPQKPGEGGDQGGPGLPLPSIPKPQSQGPNKSRTEK